MWFHQVSRGESLSGIAALHGLPAEAIVAANPSKPRIRLDSGMVVFASLSAGEELALQVLGAGDLPAGASCQPDWEFDGKLCQPMADYNGPPPAPVAPTCAPPKTWSAASASCVQAAAPQGQGPQGPQPGQPGYVPPPGQQQPPMQQPPAQQQPPMLQQPPAQQPPAQQPPAPAASMDNVWMWAAGGAVFLLLAGGGIYAMSRSGARQGNPVKRLTKEQKPANVAQSLLLPNGWVLQWAPNRPRTIWIEHESFSDSAIRYDDGRIAYDWPERIPKSVKDEVRKIYNRILRQHPAGLPEAARR